MFYLCSYFKQHTCLVTNTIILERCRIYFHYNWITCELQLIYLWNSYYLKKRHVLLVPLTILLRRFTCILTTFLVVLAPLPLYLDSLQPILSIDQFMFYLQDSKNNNQNACPTCAQVSNTWNIYLTLHDQLVLLVRKQGQ